MKKLSYGYGYKSNRDYKTKQKNSNKAVCANAKKECRKRYNYICQICGKEGLDAHHMDFDETNNSQDNLICLCRSCHERVHLERYLWTGKEYIVNTEYLLEDLTPTLKAYKEKYQLDGFMKTTGAFFAVKANNLIRITMKEIKADLGITRKRCKKLTIEDRARIKMIKAVSAWNTEVNRPNNKKEWHRICDFLNNYTDDKRDELIKLYQSAQKTLISLY